MGKTNINQIILETIKQYINETNKIRRLDDNDYPYPQLDNVNFAKVRDNDKAYNDKRHLVGKDKADTQRDNYSSPQKGIPQTEINYYQDKLTNNIQQRAKKKTGSIYQDISDMNITDNAKNKLDKAGIKLEVKGKVFTYGNHKLPADTMIINLTSAFNCPAKDCPLKNTVCYANKMEKLYTNAELRNIRNEVTLPYMSVKEILTLLDLYIKAAPCRIHRIRISEDGDFKNQEVVDFCDKLAGHVYAKYGITTTCYTHQRFDFSNCKNMIVNSSLPGNLIKGADRNYLVSSKEFMDELEGDGKIHELYGNPDNLYFKCHCDCKRCNFCYQTKEENGEPQNKRVNVYVQRH